jgi:hypothetical protein
MIYPRISLSCGCRFKFVAKEPNHDRPPNDIVGIRYWKYKQCKETLCLFRGDSSLWSERFIEDCVKTNRLIKVEIIDYLRFLRNAS